MAFDVGVIEFLCHCGLFIALIACAICMMRLGRLFNAHTTNLRSRRR